jgi:hypothetical protein
LTNKADDDQTLELVDSIPSHTDFSNVEVESFKTFLNNDEKTYLHYKQSGYSDDEIQKELGFDNTKVLL